MKKELTGVDKKVNQLFHVMGMSPYEIHKHLNVSIVLVYEMLKEHDGRAKS